MSKSKLSIFKNKTVLVTGHTGFKGSWLIIWLNMLGAKVIGLSNEIPTEPSNFLVSNLETLHQDNRIDIRDTKKVSELIKETEPDYIFHLAAQALVRPSYENPIKTMSTNSIGSANILESLRDFDKNVIVVMITSDKAYDNVEWVWGYRETDRLGGKDPYSASKGMAELAIRSYIESYFSPNQPNIRIGIARAGNVIGGGDWAGDRIVPDCMRAWSQKKSVDIRSPNATRPWQHVLEPLSGYLTLALSLSDNNKFHGEAYNFGPVSQNNQSVAELINEMSTLWESVKWNDVSMGNEHFHEAGLLKLNCDKALLELGWLPTMDFSETIEMTLEWYKEYYQDSTKCMFEFTSDQIDKYTLLAEKKNMVWTQK